MIAIPPFYRGTSFEDIVASLRIAAEELGWKITFVGSLEPLANTVPEDRLDTQAYIQGQLQLLRALQNELTHIQELLFLDFCNPGLDTLLYQMEQEGRSVKMGALFHGASFVEDDFQKGQDRLRVFEEAWLDSYDVVYVSSQHAKQAYFSARDTVRVHPWGLDSVIGMLPGSQKKAWDVIFPHRLNEDKGISLFAKIVEQLPDLSFCVALPKERSVVIGHPWYERLNACPNVDWVFGESGERHLATLARARVILSCSRQELFGYSVTKAILSGCVPIVPDAMVYQEMIPRTFRYASSAELIRLLRRHCVDEQSQKVQDQLRDLQRIVRGYSFKEILQDFFSKTEEGA